NTSDFVSASYIFFCAKMPSFEPNKRHLRELLTYFFNLKKSAAEAHRLLVEAYGEAALSETSCRKWFQKFKNGEFDVEDKERSGRPKVLDENKFALSENLHKDFESPEAASRLLKLTYFHKFEDTAEALCAATALVNSKLSKSLKKTLRNCCIEAHEQLAVADAKLGCAIKDKLQLSCVSNTVVQELMRCIRSQLDSLISGMTEKERTAMTLGLAHSLSRSTN
ncbi:NOP58 protein, partial [Acromyrmex charruanus]